MPKDKDNDRGTSWGVRVTEDVTEKIVREAERGYDVNTLRRRGGRPAMGSGPSEIVPVRLDPDLPLEERAEADATSASDVIRRALRAYLEVACTTDGATAPTRACTSLDVQGTWARPPIILTNWPSTLRPS